MTCYLLGFFDTLWLPLSGEPLVRSSAISIKILTFQFLIRISNTKALGPGISQMRKGLGSEFFRQNKHSAIPRIRQRWVGTVFVYRYANQELTARRGRGAKTKGGGKKGEEEKKQKNNSFYPCLAGIPPYETQKF